MTRWLIRIAVLLALLAQAASAVRLTRYDRAFADGRGSFDATNLSDALDQFEAARSLWDQDAEIWSWIGFAATSLYRTPPAGGWTPEEQVQMLDLTWSAYAGAVLRCPMDSWSWSGLAQTALYQVERLDEAQGLDLAEIERRGRGEVDPLHAIALAAANLAIRIEPSGYQGFDTLARIYESAGEVEKARDAYVQSARMMPAPSFHTWGSRRRLLAGLYDAILKGLDEGIAQAPVFDKSMLLLEVGKFAHAQGDLATALERLRAAKDAAPAPHYAYHALVEMSAVYEEMGRLPEAVDAMLEAHGYPFDRTAVSLRLGVLEARLERYDRACQDLRDALREMAADSALRLEVARTCRKAGDLDTAEQVLRDGVAVPGENLVLARALLDLYRTTGRPRAAEALARSWVLEYPDRPEFQKWVENLSAASETVSTRPDARPIAGSEPQEAPPESREQAR